MPKQNAVLKITKRDLISELTDDFMGLYSEEMITNVISALEENLIGHLKEATTEKPVLIKLFQGLQLTSKVVPEHEGHLDRTHYIRAERLKAHARFTRYFNRETMNSL